MNAIVTIDPTVERWLFLVEKVWWIFFEPMWNSKVPITIWFMYDDNSQCGIIKGLSLCHHHNNLWQAIKCQSNKNLKKCETCVFCSPAEFLQLIFLTTANTHARSLGFSMPHQQRGEKNIAAIKIYDLFIFLLLPIVLNFFYCRRTRNFLLYCQIKIN